MQELKLQLYVFALLTFSDFYSRACSALDSLRAHFSLHLSLSPSTATNRAVMLFCLCLLLQQHTGTYETHTPRHDASSQLACCPVPCDSDRLVLVHISRGTDIHYLTAYRTKHCNKPTGAAHYEHEYNAFNSNVNVYACGMGDDTYTMQKDDYCDVYSMDEHEITGLVGHECTDAMPIVDKHTHAYMERMGDDIYIKQEDDYCNICTRDDVYDADTSVNECDGRGRDD
jgi:hypothetical protein